MEDNMLVDLNVETLSRWYNTLNNWEWPDDLIGKPEFWDNLFDYLENKNEVSKFVIITPIQNIIEQLIGRKECLRWHHIHNLDRTNDEFEKWWNKRYTDE
jgi:hypothetical protein